MTKDAIPAVARAGVTGRGAGEPIAVIAGPTASGKTALALALADRREVTVINADSMQVYADLRILTARPTAADEASAPHLLFGVLPAAERCSVGRWLEMAVSAITAARRDGRLPVMVGGTGMYLKALMEGLAPVPEVSAAAVAEAERRYTDQGGEAFRAALADLDPGAAARLPPGDRQRLVRADVVVRATGRTLADWQASAPQGPAVAARFVRVLVMPPREDLYRRCDRRFEAMMAAGALGEVRALLDLKLSRDLPAMRALGVPELTAHLAGETDLQASVARAQQATRNFAKRQMTWFRNQMVPDLVLTGAEADGIDRLSALLPG